MAHASTSTPEGTTASSSSHLTPQYGRLSVEVDTTTDWDAKVNDYHDNDDGRTASIIDNNADWDAEIEEYWKGDKAPKRTTRTASVVDTRLDWDSAVDKYWNPSPSPTAAGAGAAADASSSTSNGSGSNLPASAMNGVDHERKSDDAMSINNAATASLANGEEELHSDEEDDVFANNNHAGDVAVAVAVASGEDSRLHSDDEDELKTPRANSGELNAFLAKLKSMEVSVVVFDLDNTACTQHSGGILPAKYLDEYIDAASADFKKVVPLLLKHNIKLAIASFTDEKFYSTDEMRTTCEAGADLVKLFLRGVFSDEIMSQFFIVAYNPRFHESEADYKKHKLHHIDLISSHYGCTDNLSEMVLFDDSKRNVDAALEVQVRGFHVDPKVGFKLNDLLQRSPPGLEGDEADSEVDE